MGRNNGAKGGDFEREVCGTLSRWWTGGARDDIYWRTAGSGARATNRAKGGKATANHYGDVCAVDPIGQPFLDILCLEIKRGYNSYTYQDALDRADANAVQLWEDWVWQAANSSAGAGSYSWAIINRRDRREAWLYLPAHVTADLRGVGALQARPRPYITFGLLGRHKGLATPYDIFGCRLADFLGAVAPSHFQELTKLV